MEFGDMKTPKKNILKNVNKQINNQCSPFRVLPDHSTPPSRFFKIKNPFKTALNAQLHKNILSSPSVFAEGQIHESAEKFRWTIEDISALRPAQIDMNAVNQLEHTTSDDEVEIQSKIEKYFSQSHISESPFLTKSSQQVVLLPENTTPQVKMNQETKESCTVWTQTVLSLPPKLPENIEKALMPYFTFTEDQRRQSVDLNSSLCRRLFHFESENEADAEEENSLHEKIIFVGSPIIEQNENDKKKRNYDSSPETPSKMIPNDISPILAEKSLNNCQISPIRTNIDTEVYRATSSNNLDIINSSLPSIDRPEDRTQQSFAKANFSGHMSVDESFNLAPENDFIIDLTESPVRSNESIESNNWDLEFNNFSLNTRPIRRILFERDTNVEKMDISNLTTPKSKFINGQRKKLSHSFKLSEDSDDELQNSDTEENTKKIRKFHHDKAEITSKNEENTQDTGYTTDLTEKSNFNDDDNIMMVEDNSDNFYSSTPSKRYFSELDK